jgi:hypothetical protein
MEGIMACLQRSLPGRVVASVLVILSILLFSTASVFAFEAQPLGVFENVAVIEASGDFAAVTSEGAYNLAPRQAVSRAFYSEHADDYDFLVVFADFDFAMPPGARAFFHAVKNDVEGLGLELFDAGNLYSADGAFLERLEGMIDMGPLASQVLEPSDVGFEQTLQALTHEMMHRWGAYLSFVDDEGQSSRALLGSRGHWSFLLDNQGSSLYGNRWVDNGDGTFTSQVPISAQRDNAVGRLLSPLELYLMGLLPSQSVPPLTLLDSSGIDPARPPQPNITIPASARNVTIDQVIAANGPRVPAAADDRPLRMGFVLLVEPGSWSPDDPADRRKVRQIGNLRRAWEERFSALTGGTALLQTALQTPQEVQANPGLADQTLTPIASPQIDVAVDWLLAQQQSDGSWSDQSQSVCRDTAQALIALEPFAAATLAAGAGQAALAAMPLENHDFFMRRLQASGGGSASAIEALQNSDGGFGSAAGYPSDPLDTALALQAMYRLGGAALGVTDAALSYLAATQNTDGGWGSSLGGSRVQASANVLRALCSWRGAAFQGTIDHGRSWLLSRQRGDGGYGDDFSTVEDSAVALPVLKELGAPLAATDALIAYLRSSQSAGGSWQQSSYLTALALEALYHGTLQADLAISSQDILVSPAVVTSSPTSVTVSAAIRNLGGTDSGPVTVALYDGPLAGSNPPVAQQLASVAAGRVTQIVFSVEIADPFDHTLSVTVDANEQLVESVESNNSASLLLDVDLPAPAMAFAVEAGAGHEAAQIVPVSVALAYAWDRPITVELTLDAASTATAGVDFVLPSTTLSFVPGELNKEFNLQILADELPESDESVLLDLQTPSAGSITQGHFSWAILSEDTPPTVGFEQPSLSIAEASGAQPVTVVLGEAWREAVTVTLSAAAASTATEGVDYSLSPTTLNFAPGETRKEVALTLLDDVVDEADETLLLDLVARGATPGSTRMSITIVNDDTPPQVQIQSPLPGPLAERTPELRYSVNRGVASVLLNGQPVEVASGQPLNLGSDGSYTVEVRAVDAYGLTGSATVVLQLDTTGPKIALVSPIAGTTPQEMVLLYYELSEGSVSSVTLDGVAISQRSGQYLQLSDGEHLLRVEAVDALGNSSFAERRFKLAANGPGLPEREETPPVLVSTTDMTRTLFEENGVGAIDTDGNFYLITEHVREVYLYKYDANGVPAWPEPVHIDFPYPAYAPYNGDNNGGIRVDGCGNVYVAGLTRQNWDYDLFAARVNAAGGIEWVKEWGSMQDDYIDAVDLDASGNFTVTGQGFDLYEPSNDLMVTTLSPSGEIIFNHDFPGNPGWAVKRSDDGAVYVRSGGIYKYDDRGSLLWHSTQGGSANIFAIDRDGNLLAAGGLLSKLDSASGALIWSVDPGAIIGEWVTTDTNNDIYLAGYLYQNGYSTPALMKFDASGRPLWPAPLALPGEGAYYSGRLLGDDALQLVRSRKEPRTSTVQEFVYSVDRYQLGTLRPLDDASHRYLLRSVSACAGASYRRGPVAVQLSESDEGCAVPDSITAKFKGRRDLLVASLDNGGYAQATRVSLAGGDNRLAFLSSDAAATASVALVEIDPASGAELGTLATQQRRLAAGRPGVMTDLSSLSGVIQAGHSFAVKLSIETATRSSCVVSWGSATDCPTGSRQQITVYEQPFDGVPPQSQIVTPTEGAFLPLGYRLIEGTASDSGSGVGLVEVQYDVGLSWQKATDTSVDGSWSSWSVLLDANKEETLHLRSRATDRDGNIETPSAAVNCTVSSVPPPELSLAITPASLYRDEASEVVLTISGASAGAALFVEEAIDLDGDGVLDDGEPVVGRFSVTDGKVGNRLVPGDADGVADGNLSVVLNGYYINDLHHIAGEHLFSIGDGKSSASHSLSVSPAGLMQALHGYVRDTQGSVVAGALVQARDPWGHNFGYAVSAADGFYRIEVEAPGEYLPVATADGYLFDLAAAQSLTLSAGATLESDIVLAAGDAVISGRVSKSAGEAVAGLPLTAQSGRFLGRTLTDFAGGYSLHLIGGRYDLGADRFSAESTQGVSATVTTPLSVDVTSGDTLPGVDLGLSAIDPGCEGAVQDAAGSAVAGVPLVATAAEAVGTKHSVLSGADGGFVFDPTAQTLSLNDTLAQGTGFIGDKVSSPALSCLGTTITVSPVEAWLQGEIVDETGQPLGGVPVQAASEAGASVVIGSTAADGSYRLGLSVGEWLVSADCAALGMAACAAQPIALAAGQTGTVDFSTQLQAVPLSVSVDDVISPTTSASQTLSGSRSAGAEIFLTVDTAASVGTVSYPEPTRWLCNLTNLSPGENRISVSASDGIDTVTAAPVAIDYQAGTFVNSIVISEARYVSHKHTLSVSATSDYADAELWVAYDGMLQPMTFDRLFKGQYRWSYVDTQQLSAPQSVTVSGSEGSVSGAVKVK